MAMRQMEPEIAEISGMKFYITPFPAFKAANLTGELASVLAPLFGVLIPLIGNADPKGNDPKGNDLMDIDAAKAAEAMAGCTAIDGDRLENLMRKLLMGGHIVVEAPDEDGITGPQRLDMDLANELFCGEVQDMFILCFHVIRLNFNGFFRKIAGQFGKEKPAGEKTPRKIF